MGTWIWNLQQGTISISEELERLLGLPSRIISGQITTICLSMCTPTTMAKCIKPCKMRFIRGQRYHVEFRVLQANGEERWLSCRGRTFTDTQYDPCLTGVLVDISDQKQAELALRVQTQRERLVADIAQRIRNELEPGKHPGTHG